METVNFSVSAVISLTYHHYLMGSWGGESWLRGDKLNLSPQL